MTYCTTSHFIFIWRLSLFSWICSDAEKILCDIFKERLIFVLVLSVNNFYVGKNVREHYAFISFSPIGHVVSTVDVHTGCEVSLFGFSCPLHPSIFLLSRVLCKNVCFRSPLLVSLGNTSCRFGAFPGWEKGWIFSLLTLTLGQILTVPSRSAVK